LRRIALIACVCATACGGGAQNRNLSYGENAERAYQAAYEDYEDGNCLDAEPAFRRVRREYSYSRFAALSELRIADCMMKEGKYPEAIQAYRQFVRYRPSHGEVPYARFKIAEAYYEQIPDDWFLAPPAYERDQGSTREALQQLRRFMVDHPDDERNEAARRMARRALRLLAQHELYVAQFYLDDDHPLAAIGRLRTLLRAYPGSGVEPEALLLLGRTYLHLRDRSEARRAFEELVTRFPRSGHAEQARGYLREIGS
jgi:outer membrane protein assembly factor BamD